MGVYGGGEIGAREREVCVRWGKGGGSVASLLKLTMSASFEMKEMSAINTTAALGKPLFNRLDG